MQDKPSVHGLRVQRVVGGLMNRLNNYLRLHACVSGVHASSTYSSVIKPCEHRYVVPGPSGWTDRSVVAAVSAGGQRTAASNHAGDPSPCIIDSSWS